MLRKRVITALVLIPIAAAAVWFGEPWFTILVAIFALAAGMEFYRLGSASGAEPAATIGVPLTLLLVIGRSPDVQSRLQASVDPALLTPFLLTLATVLSLIWVLLRRRKEGALTGWAWTMAGVLYIGWLLGHWLSLRGLPDGRNWVFLAILATVASDTSAFFAGRAIGRHRLAPQVSPGKTWEGAAAGLLGAGLISLLFALPAFSSSPSPLHIRGLSYPQAAIVGVLVSLLGQAGDLAESLLKRNAGVKDSGSIFPGHGGVLDRLDSILFAGITAYYYVLWSGLL
jgi:phosphatidate cytidylyltransferase